MNYLRGALNAASQYYTNLPPINPSTLTGAIDVIVIERPAEDGGTEFVCSPFHVRFGKWQVLRPGEKKVKVLVNGHPIPFDMKIGDAGEAFFVFETDDDVPEELITSPLLQATNVGQSNGTHDPPTGRFGSKEDEQGVEEVALQPKEKELEDDDIPQEPDFLDLNAPRTESSGTPDVRTPSPSVPGATRPSDADKGTKPSGLSVTRPSDSSISESDSTNSPEHTPSPVGATVIEKARQVGRAVVSAAEEDKRTNFETLKTKAGTVRQLAASSVPRVNGTLWGNQDSVNFHEGAGDEALPFVDEREIQPPEVTYHHDVVLDVSGYHSKEESDQTVLGEDKPLEHHLRSKTPRQSDISLTITPEASRSPSPEPFDDLPMLRFPRGASEPPEYGVSSSPPPEYSWEWGAFPQRSPLKHTFSAEDSDMPRSMSFSPLAPDAPVEQRAPSPPRSRSPIPEAALVDGGRLQADMEDHYRIWLDFEGQKLSFELSLCGDAVQREEGVEDARQFEAKRVTFTRLIEDSDVVQSPDLVVRWDDEYICRRDNSPLMPALVSWRRRTLSPPASPRPYGPENKNETRPPIAAPRPSTSTWSRWWSRNRTLPDVKESSSGQPHIPSEQDLTRKRPSLDHSASAPVDAIPLESQPSGVPQSSVPFPSAPSEGHKKYAKTLRLTSDQLKALDLKKGANSITFSLSASGQIACTARIFVWDSTDRILVSDIDGTITKSDALGHVFTMIGRDWTHLGVAKLYTDICRNGYKIMYLTSRAIGQADSTRDYLKGINQNNYQLPEGPVIMSPDRLLTSLHREVIMRKPELFKMACLRDIQRLFGPSTHNAFYAGFGNRITDALSYRSVNIPSARIFTIDSTGEVKMELLELAGYKSSYIHMTDIVDQMFPPVNRKWAPEYTDFNYWRAPVAEYELPEALSAPPSPSLSASARSDTSNQTTLSRLRHFSLGRSASRGPAIEGSPGSSPGRTTNGNIAHVGGHVRGASSLDRIGSVLVGGSGADHSNGKGKGRDDGRRGVDNVRVNTDENELEEEDARAGRSRKRFSSGSMPGSLRGSMEDRLWGMRDPRWLKDREEDQEVGNEEEDGEEGEDDDDDEGDAEEAAEEAFDDDLLATGEMEKVPFL